MSQSQNRPTVTIDLTQSCHDDDDDDDDKPKTETETETESPPAKKQKMEPEPESESDQFMIYFSYFSGEEIPTSYHIVGNYTLLDTYVPPMSDQAWTTFTGKAPKDSDHLPIGKTLREWMTIIEKEDTALAEWLCMHLSYDVKSHFHDAKKRESNIKEFYIIDAFEQ